MPEEITDAIFARELIPGDAFLVVYDLDLYSTFSSFYIEVIVSNHCSGDYSSVISYVKSHLYAVPRICKRTLNSSGEYYRETRQDDPTKRWRL